MTIPIPAAAIRTLAAEIPVNAVCRAGDDGDRERSSDTKLNNILLIMVTSLGAMIAIALPLASYAACQYWPVSPYCAYQCDTEAEAVVAANACCSAPPYSNLVCGCHVKGALGYYYGPAGTVGGTVQLATYEGAWNDPCSRETTASMWSVQFLTTSSDPNDPCSGNPDPCCGNPDPCCNDPGQCCWSGR